MDRMADVPCLAWQAAAMRRMSLVGGPASREEVAAAFEAFASFGLPRDGGRVADMDGAHFAKLAREAGLQGGRLNAIAVDIIFSKARNRCAKLFDAEREGVHASLRSALAAVPHARGRAAPSCYDST